MKLLSAAFRSFADLFALVNLAPISYRRLFSFQFLFPLFTFDH